MQPHRRQSAFTMVELLVAVLILSLIGLFVNQLFMHTQRAITTGVRTGELLVESESIGDQIARDAEAMFKPNDGTDPTQPGGILVIVNKLYNQVPIRRLAGRNVPGNPDNLYDIRSDQLIFIASDNQGPLVSLTPEDTDTFGSSIPPAQYARIWYGHLGRLNPDGSDGGNLGDEGYNRYANQWMLGRQQLLLTATPGTIYADNAEAAAAVQGYSPPTPTMSANLFAGYTDVANQLLAAPGGDPNALVNVLAASSDYLADVYPYTFAEHRLRANPLPQGLEAWQMAQTHPLLAQNVSDFIVEFAGDYEAPLGEIDKDPAGNVKWYTHAAFANPGSDPLRPTTYGAPVSANGFNNTASEPNTAYYDDSPAAPNADAIFVFRHDDGAATSKWPYLIRIRYRLHDSQGRIESTVGEPDNWVSTSGRWFEHIIPVARPQQP